MVLLQMMIHGAVRAMRRGLPELGCDCTRIGVMPFTNDFHRDTPGDGARGSEERLCHYSLELLT